MDSLSGRRYPMMPGIFALSLIVLLAGCATTPPVSLDARLPRIDGLRKLDRQIAFIHSPGFLENTTELEPYVMKIGEASDRVFRHAYALMFKNPVEIPPLTAISRADSDAVVIEPGAADLKWLRLQTGYSAVKMTQGFTLSESNGKRIAAWTIHSFVELWDENDSRDCKEGPPMCLARRAIETAGVKLARSFDRVPELARWSKGMPLRESEANTDLQGTELAAEDGWVRGRYPGVLSFRAKYESFDSLAGKRADNDSEPPPVVPIRLQLRNESSHRLLLDPLDIVWSVRGARVPPLPPRVAAARAGGLTLLLPPPPAGVGAAALPGLFVALANAATLDQSRKDFRALAQSFAAKALMECTLGDGSCDGTIYLPAGNSFDGGELIIPLIDLDAAVRYIINLPFPNLRVQQHTTGGIAP